jgi:two-component system sensor histidine kinase UhpB
VRIARELHDEIGQTLTGALLVLDQGDSPGARDAVRTALAEVREVARRLRPEALDDLGLVPALAALSIQIQRSARLRVERDLRSPGTLSAEEEVVVYRVAQEALTNVARHARAKRVTLRLGRADDAIVLEVSDDGRGLPAGVVEGAGLRGMRERAVLVGGRLEVVSAGAGLTVRLVLPR